MSRRKMRRFGGMIPPGDNSLEHPDAMPHGGTFTPEPIETSQPEMYNPQPTLPNTEKEAPFDRKLPRPWQDRQRGLGMSLRPFNINDIAVGDAAAGLSQYRRGQFFTQLNSAAIDFAELVWDIPIGMATARSSDTRPRFFHVSFFNNGVITNEGAPVSPVLESGIQGSSGQAPSLALVRGRVQIQDESGGRFFDVDILGTRSFQVYAFAVTAFILLPSVPDGTQLGFEVDRQNPTQPTLGPGLIENSFASARVLPIFQNATDITDNVTRTVTVPEEGTGFIEIPPGTTKVQLRTAFDNTAIPAGYTIAFSAFTVLTAANALGRIFPVAGTTETDVIEVPNAKFIVFQDVDGGMERTWIATFVVEV